MNTYASLDLDLADIVAVLRNAGITPTQQRLDIARVVLCRAQHLSADQIIDLVNYQGGTVSKATVYNTLALFANKGLVREVLVDPDRLFYDSNTDNHYHLYNEDTGDLTDIYASEQMLDALPELPTGTELVSIDIVFRVRQAG